MSNLTDSIKELYPNELSQYEAERAKENVLEFFQILKAVDERHEHKISENQNVTKMVTKSYENHRSSNRAD